MKKLLRQFQDARRYKLGAVRECTSGTFALFFAVF
jgi:hypothetical protein